jgi:hypothetical protein
MTSESLVPALLLLANRKYMKKVSKSQPLLQDGEMLEEYDLSEAVRGKRHSHPIGVELPGVQFLTNDRGQKTAVLFNLSLHQALWDELGAMFADPAQLQYLTDAQTQTRSVFLDFAQHLTLWQALYDRIIAQMENIGS